LNPVLISTGVAYIYRGRGMASMQVGLLGSDPHPELMHSIGDIHAQHDVVCKRIREIGTRSTMCDNQQTVHCVAVSLTARSFSVLSLSLPK
jgi:hypothetical protein